jgi:RNA polymerase sigma factor (sigma-70 family)
MNSRSLVPAVLLLTLSAQPGLATSAPVAQRGRVRTTANAVETRPDAMSAQSVALAGEYLRQSVGKQKASIEAREAWDQFYPACDATIRAFAARFFKTPTDIDDCTQEVWIDLIRNLPDFNLDQNRGRFTSWLFTIVRNKATDMVRRQVRRPAGPLTEAVFSQPDLASEDPPESLSRKLDVQSVHDALATLKESTSEENYRILHLRHVEGRDVADVAAVLGISSHQVWSREHRMKQKLREVLGRDGEVASETE